MNSSFVQVATLAIGTELTQGQILNRNSYWLSGLLAKLGFEMTAHLAVPDERTLILDALRFLENKCEILFVTGGLGPTSDDFTRDLIAEWSGCELQWHEPSWQHVVERMTSRGLVVREMQRQQCYFPAGATVIKNKMGTANAFSLSVRKLKVFVLPGPPKEIEAVWNDFILQEMTALADKADSLITQTWDTLGYGESEVATRAEAVLGGCPYQVGYRVHLPFVEFKFSYPRSEQSSAQAWIAKIDTALNEMTVARNGFDFAQELVRKYQGKKVLLVDMISQGYLLNRLMTEAKKINLPLDWTVSHCEVSGNFDVQLKVELGKAFFNSDSIVINSPYQHTLLRDRENHYYCEKALQYWTVKPL